MNDENDPLDPETMPVDPFLGTKKRRGRPFEVGNTAGKGRPKGSLNKTTLLMKEALTEYAEDIARNTALMGSSGNNNVALQIVWQRLWPARAGSPVEFDMPIVRCADDVLPAYNALLQAVANGQLTPAEAIQMTRVLEAASRVVGFEFGTQPDTKEILERIQQMRQENARRQEPNGNADLSDVN